jgi:hypothetical protein
MTEHNPDHDPLGDRLRATFAAEHDDMVRRHAAAPASRRQRSFAWIPFAAAAALIAIGGIFFVTNRDTNQAVELDVAGQPSEPAPAPTNLPTATDDDSRDEPFPPTEPPTDPPTETLPPQFMPSISGENLCGTRFDPNRNVAYEPERGDAPTANQPFLPGIPYAVDVVIPSGTRVTLMGGCTHGDGPNSPGPVTWYEISGNPNPRWINADFLITEAEWLDTGNGPVADPTPAEAPCSVNELDPVRFIWNIPPNDPDGGLVAHTEAGVDAPVTRVIAEDNIVRLTGRCEVLPSGTPWFELVAPTGGGEWVSGNFLARPEPACLFGQTSGINPTNGQTDRTKFGAVDGQAIANGDLTAFASIEDATYRYYPSENIAVATPCFLPAPTGPICVADQFATYDAFTGESTGSRQGPMTLFRTGRAYSPLDRRGLAEDLLEVRLIAQDVAPIQFIDPASTEFEEGPCDDPLSSSSDAFADLPCTVDSASDTSAGQSSDSQVNHIHEMRVELSPTCTRVVIVLGSGRGDAIGPARLVPPLRITQNTSGLKVEFPECGLACGAAFDNRLPSRLDFNGVAGTAFIGISQEGKPYLRVLHAEANSNVTLLENPARIVLDLEQTDDAQISRHLKTADLVLLDPPAFAVSGPTSRQLLGWSRPFEAAGTFVVLATGPDYEVDAEPNLVVNEPFQTTGWVDGWGEFTVTLPDLDPGHYLIGFGQEDASGEFAFIGTGRPIHVISGPTPGGPPGQPIYDLNLASLD